MVLSECSVERNALGTGFATHPKGVFECTTCSCLDSHSSSQSGPRIIPLGWLKRRLFSGPALVSRVPLLGKAALFLWGKGLSSVGCGPSSACPCMILVILVLPLGFLFLLLPLGSLHLQRSVPFLSSYNTSSMYCPLFHQASTFLLFFLPLNLQPWLLFWLFSSLLSFFSLYPLHSPLFCFPASAFSLPF